MSEPHDCKPASPELLAACGGSDDDPRPRCIVCRWPLEDRLDGSDEGATSPRMKHMKRDRRLGFTFLASLVFSTLTGWMVDGAYGAGLVLMIAVGSWLAILVGLMVAYVLNLRRKEMAPRRGEFPFTAQNVDGILAMVTLALMGACLAGLMDTSSLLIWFCALLLRAAEWRVVK